MSSKTLCLIVRFMESFLFRMELLTDHELLTPHEFVWLASFAGYGTELLRLKTGVGFSEATERNRNAAGKAGLTATKDITELLPRQRICVCMFKQTEIPQ